MLLGRKKNKGKNNTVLRIDCRLLIVSMRWSYAIRLKIPPTHMYSSSISVKSVSLQLLQYLLVSTRLLHLSGNEDSIYIRRKQRHILLSFCPICMPEIRTVAQQPEVLFILQYWISHSPLLQTRLIWVSFVLSALEHSKTLMLALTRRQSNRTSVLLKRFHCHKCHILPFDGWNIYINIYQRGEQKSVIVVGCVHVLPASHYVRCIGMKWILCLFMGTITVIIGCDVITFAKIMMTIINLFSGGELGIFVVVCGSMQYSMHSGTFLRRWLLCRSVPERYGKLTIRG